MSRTASHNDNADQMTYRKHTASTLYNLLNYPSFYPPGTDKGFIFGLVWLWIIVASVVRGVSFDIIPVHVPMVIKCPRIVIGRSRTVPRQIIECFRWSYKCPEAILPPLPHHLLKKTLSNSIP